MSDESSKLSRRRFLMSGAGALAVGAVGAVGTGVLGRFGGAGHGTDLRQRLIAGGPAAPAPAALHLAATDGWVSMPAGAPAIPPFWPDSLAPANLDLYVFGFRNVTGLSDAAVKLERGKAQISAPMLGFDQGQEVKITLTNLGLSVRPDLVDGHSVHWHGFKNAIPLFDGVPELSVAVPIDRSFTYFYRPADPGTYMYHCHFEDVEHVQMGMTGIVFVRPAQNGMTGFPGKYVYNDGDGSTRYDREFCIFMSEIWAEAHYRDAHIQTTDWTDYKPSFWLMNGRAYPDTMAPNTDPLAPGVSDDPRLRYQPISSVVTANPGDRVLLRIANLGYQNHTVTAAGIDLTVVGKDASFLRGRDGTNNYIETNAVDVGPGESRDVLFTAPTTPGTYLLYNRAYADLNNAGGQGYGGQLTEVRVSANPLPPQTGPNT